MIKNFKLLLSFIAGLLLLSSCHFVEKKAVVEQEKTKRKIASIGHGYDSFWSDTPNIGDHVNFYRIPAKTFMMGSLPEGKYRRKLTKVTITKPFEIMDTKMPQYQWFKIMGRNPSNFKSWRYCSHKYKIKNGVGYCSGYPVENISWNDIQVFVKKLNDRFGLRGCKGTPKDPRGCYRLPTEAEWEWTAINVKERDRKQARPIRWGDSYDICTKEEIAEWVQDIYRDELPKGIDPVVLSGGSYRVTRDCVDYEEGLSSADRLETDPNSKKNPGTTYISFRLVRTL